MRGIAFCRRRDTLIREAKTLLGEVPQVLMSLPEHHDGFVEVLLVAKCVAGSRISQPEVSRVTCSAWQSASLLNAWQRPHERPSSWRAFLDSTKPEGPLPQALLKGRPTGRVLASFAEKSCLSRSFLKAGKLD